MSRSAARGGPRGVAVRSSRALAVLVLAALALLPAAGPAAAHDDLVGSAPRQAQELEALPAEVELEFDQPALPGYSAVAVTAPDGTDLARGDATEGDVFVRMAVDPAPMPGEYVMAYRVVASDGHPISGEITFTVTGEDRDDGEHSEDGEDADDSTASPSNGASASSAPSTTGAAAPQPTTAPAQEPTAVAGEALGAATDADGSGPSAGTLGALALLAAGVAAVAWLLLRRRRPTGHAG